VKCRINHFSLTVTVEQTFLSILAGMKSNYGNVLGIIVVLNRILFHYTVLEITTRSVNHIHLVISICK
jgi:ABC-type branched-subunit amino acid transport system permease subunit